MSKFVPVYFLDNSFKTVSIDSSTTCEELAENVCDQIELVQCREDFRFFVLNGVKEILLSPSDRPYEYLSGVDMSHGNDPMATKIVFKRAFVVKAREEEITDEVLTGLLYHQCRCYVMAGLWPTTIEQAIDLAGIQMVCRFGAPKEALPAGFLLPSLREFVPHHLYTKIKPKVWESKILASYRNNGGLTLIEAENRYHMYCREYIPTYGTIPYTGICVRFGEQKVKGKVYISVSSEGIHILNATDMSRLRFFPMDRLKSWNGEGTVFSFGAAANEDDMSESGVPYVFDTQYATQLATMLKTYVELVLHSDDD